MMNDLSVLLAAVFLPLFPMSMVFNALFQRATSLWVRVPLLLLWPLPGIWWLGDRTTQLDAGASTMLLTWAWISALLYAFRSGTVKELGVWIGFMASSAWALLWFPLTGMQTTWHPSGIFLAFSIPLVLLLILAGEIERRYRAAYAGVVHSLAVAQPRLAAMLVIVVLAVIASPLFPAFFVMLDLLVQTVIRHPLLTMGLSFVWLLWSWSAMRLLSGFVVGATETSGHEDISMAHAGGYGMALLFLVAGGWYAAGGL